MNLNPRIPFSIARVTFWEIVRDKVLYNIAVFSVLLLATGFLASRLSFIRPERIVLDFGISAINFSTALLAVLMGSSLIPKELQRRTIHVAISRPVSRFQFVSGKFFGLAAVITANWIFLCIAFVVVLSVTGDRAPDYMTPTLALSLFLLLIQSWLMASLSILLSSFSTTSLAIMMSLGFYLIGNNISQIHYIASKMTSTLAMESLNALSTLLPNLEYFNIGIKATYGMPIGALFGALSVFYGAAVITLCLVLAGFFLQSREV